MNTHRAAIVTRFQIGPACLASASPNTGGPDLPKESEPIRRRQSGIESDDKQFEDSGKEQPDNNLGRPRDNARFRR